MKFVALLYKAQVASGLGSAFAPIIDSEKTDSADDSSANWPTDKNKAVLNKAKSLIDSRARNVCATKVLKRQFAAASIFFEKAQRQRADDAYLYEKWGDVEFCKGLAGLDPPKSFMSAFEKYHRAYSWEMHASERRPNRFGIKSTVAAACADPTAACDKPEVEPAAPIAMKADVALASAVESSTYAAAAAVEAGDVVDACRHLAFVVGAGAPSFARMTDQWSSALACRQNPRAKLSAAESAALLRSFRQDMAAQTWTLPEAVLRAGVSSSKPSAPQAAAP